MIIVIHFAGYKRYAHNDRYEGKAIGRSPLLGDFRPSCKGYQSNIITGTFCLFIH